MLESLQVRDGGIQSGWTLLGGGDSVTFGAIPGFHLGTAPHHRRKILHVDRDGDDWISVASSVSPGVEIEDVTVFDRIFNGKSDSAYKEFFGPNLETSYSNAEYGGQHITSCMASPVKAYLLEPDRPLRYLPGCKWWRRFIVNTAYLAGRQHCFLGEVCSAMGDVESLALRRSPPQAICPPSTDPQLLQSSEYKGGSDIELLVICCHIPWLVVLSIFPLAMLVVGLADAIWGSLRQGPNIPVRFTPVRTDRAYSVGTGGSWHGGRPEPGEEAMPFECHARRCRARGGGWPRRHCDGGR